MCLRNFNNFIPDGLSIHLKESFVGLLKVRKLDKSITLGSFCGRISDDFRHEGAGIFGFEKLK
jgi:hypothetical protein